YRPEREVRTWAIRQTFKPLTPHTITSSERLLKDLRNIRARGYGLDDEEREIGVRCIAAPVRNHEGDVVAAISVAGPAERMPRALEGSEMAKVVVAAAQDISVQLGAPQETVAS